VEFLIGLEFGDVVEEGGDAGDVGVCALLLGDLDREIDHVEDVVVPVFGGVPGIPAHPTTFLFFLDARGEILEDEALHCLELGVGHSRFFLFQRPR